MKDVTLPFPQQSISMKYRIIFNLIIFAQIVNLPVHGQGLFSDLYDGLRNRLRGNSSQSASTSAAPARASSSSSHNSSTSSSSAESHSTSSSLGFHALQESSHTTLSITPQVSRSSTTSPSSGSHVSQESSRTPSPDRPQVPTTSRIRASNRNTGITIREPSENARQNTSTDRSRTQELAMRARKTAQFKKMARLEHRLRLDMADNPNSYSSYVLRNRRNTQDAIRNHLQTRLSSQAQRINTRRSSRIANNRERIIRGGNVPTPSRQRSSRRNGHNESQDQVVPVQQVTNTNQQLSGHRRTRSEWNSHASSSSSQPQPLPNKDIIVQHPPSKPGGPPVIGLAIEAPFEPDRKGKKKKTE